MMAHRKSQPAKDQQLARIWKRPVLLASIAAVIGSMVLSGGVVPSASASPAIAHEAAASGSLCGAVTMYEDSVRVPDVADYEKAHPCVHIQATVFPYGPTWQAKIGLFNKEGSGWPDIAWDPSDTDAGWLDSAQYHYAAVLNNGLVPQSLIDQWADNSLSVCESGGKVYCLRDNIGANVLYYNAPLMKKFGYAVPATWAQYEALGEKVAVQHPGYVIGTIGDSYSDDAYFWPSECPANELTNAPMTVEINMSSPDCVRVANMLDPLIKDHSISTLSITSPDFAKRYGDNDHLLLDVGPTWYGIFVFQSAFKSPNRTWGVSLPLTWPGDNYTGDVGGGIWQVSSHASPAVQKLSASIIEWLTTSPVYEDTAPTYPANKYAAVGWVNTTVKNGFFANDPSDVFHASANLIWPGYSDLLFDVEDVWSATVVPALVSGKSMSSLLGTWQSALTDQAKVFGYSVIK